MNNVYLLFQCAIWCSIKRLTEIPFSYLFCIFLSITDNKGDLDQKLCSQKTPIKKTEFKILFDPSSK